MPAFALSLPLALVGLAALGPSLAVRPAHAQGTSEQRAACTGDAMRLCLSALPDVGRITACMKAHYGELSPRCQASFNEGSHAAPAHKLAEEPRKPAEAKPEPKTADSKAAEPKTEPKAAEPKTADGNATGSGAAESRAAANKAAEADRPAAKRAEARAPQARREAMRRERVARNPDEPDAPRSSRAAAPRRHRDTGDGAPRLFASREAPAPSARLPRYPEIEGGAVYAAAPPPVVPARTGSLAFLCRRGMIDAYTCGHTIPTLGLDD